MNGLNTIASILLGSYLVAVSVKGNANELIEYAVRDRAFLQWIIAVGVLYWLYEQEELKGIASLLIFTAAIAFLMQAGPEFSTGVKELWKKLNTTE